MKTLFRSFLLACVLISLPCAALVTGGCSTPPTQRNVTVQTLKTVGQAAEAAVVTSAKLYEDGKISAVQARAVLDAYNNKFQPAFRLARTAAKSDLSTVASPDLVNLALQLTNLINTYTTP